MVNDNLNLLKSIEQIHESICDECQRSSDFAPKKYQQCCKRILNATMVLYDDIIAIIQNNLTEGIVTKLSLFNLIELQKNVLAILQEPDNIINKEKLMHQLFAQQKISPRNYFKLNHKISELLASTPII